ncbi:MAG: hypothetical protein QM500_19325 [Methylococcales bacterium]
MDDITKTLAAKSDQLNAADLVGGGINVKIESVTVSSGSDQPVIIKIGEGMQPYKPCKTMRRLLAAIWGTSSVNWIGQSMTLYCDMDVMWAGQKAGGIRISHVTGIAAKRDIPLRSSKHKVTTYTIQPLVIELPAYNDSDIEANKVSWIGFFENEESTPDKLINSICKKFTITEDQKTTIRNLVVISE